MPGRDDDANGLVHGAQDSTAARLAQARKLSPSARRGRAAGCCREASVRLFVGHFRFGCSPHRLALAVGPGDDPVGRQGAFPAADPVPGAEPGARRLSRMGAVRVQRASADRRSAIRDLLADVPGPGPARRRAQPVGGRCRRARDGVSRRRGADAVVPRPGMALAGRTDRRARLLLRGIDGLAHPAHGPDLEPRLSAGRDGVSRPGVGAGIDPLRRCRRPRRGLHGAGARSGGAAGDLSACGTGGLAPALGIGAAGCLARKHAAARGRGAMRGTPHRRAGAADRHAGPGLQPPLDRLHRRRARLAASRIAADARDARRVRRLGPHGRLLGPAELRVARYRHLPRAEHGRALHRRHPAPANAHRRRPWTAVGAGDPLLHLCCGHCAPLCSRLVHAGLSRPVRAGAGRRPLSSSGGRGVPDRRARRDPGRLRRPSAARRAPRGHRPPAGDRSRAPPSGWRSCWRSAWGCGSAACPDSRCRCWRRSSRSPPRPPR